jgi:NADPH2:quinone reductase
MGSDTRIHAIRVAGPGGLEALEWVELDLPTPMPAEIQVRHEAIGVNMIDTYVTSGAYEIEPYPLTPGVEGAGVVTAVGEAVTGFQVGDRVVYGGPPLGAYASARNMPPAYVAHRPDWLNAEVAAASMIAGLTAWMMVERVYPVQADTHVLVHAAAGSTGAAIGQFAAARGARVIGTVGDDAKMALAQRAGCAEVINYRRDNYADVVLRLTDGRGVDVIYDGVGRDTFSDAFRALTPVGMFVSYGQASGPLPPLRLDNVPVTFSNFIARPSVFSWMSHRSDFEAAVSAVFAALRTKHFGCSIRHRYPLRKAADAHRDLLSRRTTGSIVLLPD